VAALADAAPVVEGLDLEADHPALDRDHLRRGPHRCADRGRGEMADIDLVPTVTQPGCRQSLMASPDAISISRIIIGVA